MTRAGFFSLALSVLGLLVSGRAQAFEREWHVGGGLGLTAYPQFYSAGPALGVNAGYGVSDVFDVKLELLGSWHDYDPNRALPAKHADPYSVAAGLSYKLDVLQWIPYAAVLVGFQHVAGALPVAEPFHRDDGIAALVLGLDYAMTRNFGLGLSLRSDMLLSSPTNGESLTTMLRAEYHWGF